MKKLVRRVSGSTGPTTTTTPVRTTSPAPAEQKLVVVGDSGVGKTNIINRLRYGTFSLSTPPTIGMTFVEVDVAVNLPIGRPEQHGDEQHGASGPEAAPVAARSGSDGDGAMSKAGPSPGIVVEGSVLGQPAQQVGGTVRSTPESSSGGAESSGDYVRCRVQLWDSSGTSRGGQQVNPASLFKHCTGVVVVYDGTRRETFMNVPDWTAKAKLHCEPGTRFLLLENKCDLGNMRDVDETDIRTMMDALSFDAYARVSALTGDGLETALGTLAELAREGAKRRSASSEDRPLVAGREDDEASHPEGAARPSPGEHFMEGGTLMPPVANIRSGPNDDRFEGIGYEGSTRKGRDRCTIS